jgi:signal transduction histidine kinase
VAQHLKLSTGGSEFVFLSQGRVIATSLPPRDAALIASQLSRGGHSIRAGASEYAPLITPLADIDGGTVGQLAILRSFDTANREIAGLRRTISLLWLASVVAGLALAYVPARRIVEPIRALDRAAAEVARQNYDCEVLVESQDELGRLAATFNAMCASIRKAREDLIRSERISTIGRLATSIVHDLRNPLAAVYGGAEMLMYAQLSEAHVQRLAGNMYRASLRIQELLQDLLDVGRGHAGEINPHDLHDLVADVVASFAATAEAQSVKIEVDVPENLEVPLDQHRIQRVFMNLVGNALEVMPQGGTISISAENKAGSVVIDVRDTGPGIAPEIRDRLFQPFVTARKGTGLGLGLALARQAVMDHGGDMWANAAVARGACFSFRLPLHTSGP